MKIGLDLDGTVYAHPEFFAELIKSMTEAGHEFYCVSSHGRDQWENDCERLMKKGVPAYLISPDLMQDKRHASIKIKGDTASKLDLVFDDDFRIQQFTSTPVMCPLLGGHAFPVGDRVEFKGSL